MRLTFSLTPNDRPVPYTYPYQLTGAFHSLAGWNDAHDRLSCYSLGWLESRNSQSVPVGLNFPKGATWSVSIQDSELAKEVRRNAKQHPPVAFGMKIYRVAEKHTPAFGSVYRFEVGSPVLVRKPQENGRQKHLLFDDPEADAFLTQTMRRKLEAAGFSSPHLNVMVGFDRSYGQAKTKLVEVKSTKYRCNVCPVIVAGTPEAVQFAWNVGAGHLTGSGFGFLK